MICPSCGLHEMVKQEFYEHGYKFRFICPVKLCPRGDLLFEGEWFNSRGIATTPHETWVKRSGDRRAELDRIATGINSHRPRNGFYLRT
jgi:hypothetical protein